MKKTLMIFKKEFIDTVRDRRTILMMIVLPLLIFPLMMGVVTKITASQTQKAKTKILKVGLVTNGNAERFRTLLKERDDMTVDESIKAEDADSLIQDKTKDFIIVFDENFDGKTGQKESGTVHLHFKSSRENDIAKRRINSVFNQFKGELLDGRLKEVNLTKEFVEPLVIKEVDIVTVKEKLGQTIGGFLPYIFVLFCFLGAMYPAIDLAAGEKEKSTLETLLTSPASRMQIVLGKFFVITLAGLISAGISIVGLFIAIKLAVRIPQHILDALLRIVEPSSILLILSLLIPLCVFFAAILLSMSLYAKSFKEAQSIMTPMNIIVLLPLLIGTLPGMKLTTVTALIPVFNVSMATKAIIAGTIQPGLLLLVYLSLFVLAVLSLMFCAKWFNREDVIFRGI